jgi:hypothetical protein
MPIRQRKNRKREAKRQTNIVCIIIDQDSSVKSQKYFYQIPTIL